MSNYKYQGLSCKNLFYGRMLIVANKEQAAKKTDKKKPSDTKVKKEKKTYN